MYEKMGKRFLQNNPWKNQHVRTEEVQYLNARSFCKRELLNIFMICSLISTLWYHSTKSMTIFMPQNNWKLTLRLAISFRQQ